MSNSAIPQQGGPDPRAANLPDVNAEITPYDVVQYLLDQTANFSILAVPDPLHGKVATLTPGDPNDYFGINGGYGLDIACNLHRFDSVADMPTMATGIIARQNVGESTGTLRARWLFAPEGMQWDIAKEPPPAIFDPWRSQPFAFQEGTFSFGSGESFQVYGVGRTFPMVVKGEPQLFAGAVGNIMSGAGKFRGLEGTFVMTGVIRDLNFEGNITVRVVDPEGRLRGSDVPAMTTIADPMPNNTFVVMRGEKKNKAVKTTYGPPPDAERVSLITPSQMRSARFNFSRHGRSGLAAEMKVHQVIGTMDANVSFNLLAPPGTAARPVPFTTDEIYKFYDEAGQLVGTIHAGVVEGQSWKLSFPAAPNQPGVRFAGFGPIYGGTGAFEGVQGMLTVNSLIGISPHTLSLMHVLHIADPKGKFRPAEDGGLSRLPQGLPSDDIYQQHLQMKEKYHDSYIYWRRGIARHADKFAPVIARYFNDHLHMGDFEGLAIDPAALRDIFANQVPKFDPEVLDRYDGPALGVFRTYRLDTKEEVPEGFFELYSVWNRSNVRIGQRVAKKITGSFHRFYDPTEPLPVPAERKVDYIFNSFHPETGITSWVEMFQAGRQQRTSFSYKLPHHPHEVLWFVKDISMNDQLLDNSVFMASHEWKGEYQGTVGYFMVAFFFEMDMETGDIKPHGETFWRSAAPEA